MICRINGDFTTPPPNIIQRWASPVAEVRSTSTPRDQALLVLDAWCLLVVSLHTIWKIKRELRNRGRFGRRESGTGGIVQLTPNRVRGIPIILQGLVFRG